MICHLVPLVWASLIWWGLAVVLITDSVRRITDITEIDFAFILVFGLVGPVVAGMIWAYSHPSYGGSDMVDRIVFRQKNNR